MAIDLGEFRLQYRPWKTIKGQALVDFIIECFFEGPMDTYESVFFIITSSAKPEALVKQPLIFPAWGLYVNSSSNINGSKVRIMLVSFEEQVLEYRVYSEFLIINNVLKYKVFLARLHLAGPLNAYQFKVYPG